MWHGSEILGIATNTPCTFVMLQLTSKTFIKPKNRPSVYPIYRFIRLSDFVLRQYQCFFTPHSPKLSASGRSGSSRAHPGSLMTAQGLTICETSQMSGLSRDFIGLVLDLGDRIGKQATWACALTSCLPPASTILFALRTGLLTVICR